MNKEEEAELKRKLEVLWRGMYGEDEPNRTTGIVEEVRMLKKFNDNVRKYGYVVLGIGLAIRGAVWIVEKLHII